MRKVSEDSLIDNYLEEFDTSTNSGVDLVEVENKRYTFNGVVLDAKERVVHDLTAIRIHMIDFGFDDYDKASYEYLKDEIERCRVDIDEGKITEAAARVICMELVMGIEINMKSVLMSMATNKIAIPEEFYGDVPQGMLLTLLEGDAEEARKKLPGVFIKDDYNLLKKKRGK